MATKETKGVLSYVDGTGDKILLYPAVDTDTTLNIAGEPADAAAVGTAISETNENVSNLDTTVGTLNEKVTNMETNGSGNIIKTYDDLMANTVDSNIAGAVAVKDGFNQLNSSLSEISSSSNKVPISLSFNSNLNITMISSNALFYKNGVYYIDVMINTKNSASANTGIFSIVKEENVIHINRRLDAFLEGNSTNYGMYKSMGSDTLAVNGTTIPAGNYKLKMTIEE